MQGEKFHSRLEVAKSPLERGATLVAGCVFSLQWSPL